MTLNLLGSSGPAGELDQPRDGVSTTFLPRRGEDCGPGPDSTTVPKPSASSGLVKDMPG